MVDVSKCRGGGSEATDGAARILDAAGGQRAYGQRAFPSFEFYALPLSLPARHQLSNVYKTRGCWQLADLIRKHAFNPANGYYVPISKDVYLVRKLPEVLRALSL